MNPIFSPIFATDNWVLDNLTSTSSSVAQIKLLQVIILVILALMLLLVAWILMIKSTTVRNMEEILEKIDDVLRLTKGYEALEKTHKDQTKQVLYEIKDKSEQMKEDAKTITNAAAEMKQAAATVIPNSAIQ